MGFYIVAGAAGFIGSKVSEILLLQGHEVIGIDNLNDAYDPRMKSWRLQRLTSFRGFRLLQIDICDRLALATALDGVVPEAVINLAARAGVRPSVDNPWMYLETNASGTLNLLDFCRRAGVRKFILASTSSLYGAHNEMPYREDADTSRPLSPYAASKKAAEALCYAYHHLHGINVTVFRYFTVYGPAGRPDMSVFRFVQWVVEGRPVVVYGDGTQRRDFTYVDDIARGTVAGLDIEGYQVINLGSDRPVELRAVLASVERLTEQTADIRSYPAHPADVPATWADITQARQLLNWEPRTNYMDGVSNTVEWYLANRSWASQIDTSEGLKKLGAAAR
jgi:nucleoside-diphosphate-sugar epimerase